MRTWFFRLLAVALIITSVLCAAFVPLMSAAAAQEAEIGNSAYRVDGAGRVNVYDAQGKRIGRLRVGTQVSVQFIVDGMAYIGEGRFVPFERLIMEWEYALLQKNKS